ncbi:MAG: DUF4912 domain-containing protein [Chthoniobacterales bacterium]
MEEADNLTTRDTAPRTEGFRISSQPVVGIAQTAGEPDELPASYGTDLLYVVARDPNSLFLYWDLNWTRLFASAGLAPRQIHLRIYRGEDSVEATREINPFRGYCYVDVAAAGTTYFCELGCFDGNVWKSLARSGTTSTPESAVSDDLSATFATLPIHLSFQRLLDIFRTTRSDDRALASSVAELQENARMLKERLTPEAWSRLVAATAASLDGTNCHGNGAQSSELAALLQSVRPGPAQAPTEEQRAKWRALSEEVGGASWSGGSEGDFGESSPRQPA